MKILTVIGARPQFIKASSVSRWLAQRPLAREVIVHTGQHYDYEMNQIFFEQLELRPPDYHLNIGSGTHGAQTGRMLEAIEQVLFQEKPDWVLVYGDTNSTLAGALAAAKCHIPVAHVEAGLRSFNRRMPEEVNRVLTDHLSSLLFAPTPQAVENLRREGIAEGAIHLVGDVMYDSALYYAQKAEHVSSILETLSLKPKEYVLATLHRAENTDDPARLEAILRGLAEVAQQIPLVLPMHPRTRRAVEQFRLMEALHPIRVTEPLGYLDMLLLEKHARLIVTDSGGVQKEAFFYRVPCVTLRDETEWVELVAAGWNRLAPPRTASDVKVAVMVSLASQPPEQTPALYGDGAAGQRIVDILLSREGVKQ
ncbi:MAG: UDP-N-acetylglucosamine 2-epimerase (non-hydrolyzing) [Fimbriimonadales bacterium]|jgi:UDP-GlcNAc3NAcA epimerase|nr:UDP-N-acetylglucosamine 2-epimerase (non-hydrolyzing) [Fimbriimonadales bacterium]GBC90642.1 UDP-2,3-diacetamido-2,3-dideoxy-D-glucuronate 2-epimerase [bacterium HR14]